jgi:trehalose 6-phosphate phosphatase
MPPLTHLAKSALPPLHRAALFLDFDGTLVDLAPRPDAITVDAGLPDLLAGLSRQMGGALALVSGRAVDDLRRHLTAFSGVIVGGHGAEWRLAATTEPRVHVEASDLAAMTQAAGDFAATHPDLLLERKPTGLVLHYRAAPARQGDVERFAHSLAAHHPAFETHASKMAVEMRPLGVGKDKALADLMALPVFANRIPVIFGDDTTDEPAMVWAQDRGGVGIKVGPGPTQAVHRLNAPVDVLATLRAWT